MVLCNGIQERCAVLCEGIACHVVLFAVYFVGGTGVVAALRGRTKVTVRGRG